MFGKLVTPPSSQVGVMEGGSGVTDQAIVRQSFVKNFPFIFKFEKIAQLVGDSIVYEIIKTCNVLKISNMNNTHYFSAYNFISADYLLRYLENFTEFNPIVILSIGFCEQFIDERIRSPNGFAQLFGRIRDYLFANGVENIMAIVPPPNPQISPNRVLLSEFYEKMCSVYRESVSSGDNKFHIIDTVGITHRINGNNIDVFSNAYSIGMKGAIRLSRSAMAAINERLRDRLRQFNSNKQVTPNIEVNSSTVEDILPDGGIFYVAAHVNVIYVKFLIDSGASLSFISRDYLDSVKFMMDGDIQVREYDVPFTVTLAVGKTTTKLQVASVRFSLGRKIILTHRFILLPELSEKVILGGDFFMKYQCEISYRVPRQLKILDSQGYEIGIALEPNTLVCDPDIQVVRSIGTDVNLVGFMNSLPPLEQELEMGRRLTVMKASGDLSEVVATLHSKLNDAVISGNITAEEADVAFNELKPFAQVFRPELGRYRHEKVQLQFSPVDRWKPRRYGVPIAYRKVVAEEIRSMLEQGIIKISDTQYINPLVVRIKKNGRARVCLDGFGVNEILYDEHHNAPKVEDVLFEAEDAEFMSSFDFAQGFLQLETDEERGKLLGFEFEGTAYEYCRLAFGLKVSSSKFNHIVR